MPSHTLRKLLATGGVIALSPVVAACGGADDAGAGAGTATPQTTEPAKQQEGSSGASTNAPAEITGGQTTLRLNGDFVNALSRIGVDVGATGAATMQGDRIAIPITDGSVDTDSLSGRIEHGGGVSFSVAGRTIKATDLVIEPKQNVVTAEIAGRRVPFLGVDFKHSRTVPSSGTFVLPATATTLSPNAIPGLGDLVDVGDGVTLGRLTVSAKRR